ncbi:carbohydrate ABC transporter permease [Sutcliffiella rhizosphaerae]|uniref:Inner membrane ABC transporter permease protein YcjP n=1 Tax=Sutcliffiella rhizosphaerae TaxID=2880967 RepID=A0ABN8A7W2_9BACI|nr:carbohydrate ABC transporter permease [Sutcliffiella rhizosphaerae]CAG9621149.1 Inner membrane ABC transporter permease protein YcjP [Sutcliffiella rhizosphaerae]
MAVMQTKGEKAFSIFNYLILGGFALLCLFPFLHVIAQSLSSQRAIVSGEVIFLPIETTFLAYKEVFMDQHFLRAFGVSVARTVVGTFINVFLTCLMAYPLSKTYIKGRGIILFMVVFTMLFSGGMIPTYLVVRETGLLNTFWAYIIPTAISAFNLIIVKNFFQSVPAELEESAKMDGASNIGILFKIVIPLSMPVIATIGLFHAVFHWNSFFDAVLYINDRSLYPLQVYLRELIQFDQSEINLRDNFEQQLLANESLKAAALISSTIPILIVYPFLQKYFVKGVMLGSVKG